METVNRYKMVEKVYPVLLERMEMGMISEHMVHDVIAATADGYSFPTNLDSDPPLGGNVPVTAQQLMYQALAEKRPSAELMDQLAAYAKRRRA